MTTFDLDPVFSLALKLMHSKSKDSAEQLRMLLEEVTKQKYGGSSRLLPAMKRLGEEKFDSKKSASVEVSSKSSTKSPATVQQTSHHQVSSAVSSPASPHSKTEEITGSSETLGSSRVISVRHGSDGSDSDDVDDLALEILEEDLMCVVCRGMDVGVRNRLVECVECHSLYHQECHKPAILEAHASDPRRVWTCSACSKPASQPPPPPPPPAVKPSPPVRVGGGKPISSMTSKKVELKPPSSSGTSSSQQASSKSGSSSSSSKSTYSSSSSKSASSSSSTKASSSSKNTDQSSSSKQSSTSSSSSGGSSGGGSSGSGNSVSSSSTSKASSSKIAHADKRIQIMKKKAAKLQEKRKLSK